MKRAFFGLFSFNWQLGFGLVATALSGCAPTDSSDSIATQTLSEKACAMSPPSSGFTITGRATFDWIPAKDAVTEGGVRLDYGAKVARPIRRAVAQAVNACTGAVESETVTNELGDFTLIAPAAHIIVRVSAQAKTSQSASIGNCLGASWDVQVVDNTHSKAIHAVETEDLVSSTVAGLALHASTVFSSGGYGTRAGAPFALLDVAVKEIDLVCQSVPNTQFPLFYINWSPDNVSVAGDKSKGEITTSHYTIESGVSNLYILGKADVDTDEYDDHVVAHEIGHYLENEIYRSDSIGGRHSMGESLDARVAFGEGYGNAMSAMVFNDPIYVDTMGTGQASGGQLRIDTAPSGDDRGYYSERSVQYLLWKLYSNRSSYDRLHQVLKLHRTTGALTTVMTFASLYNQLFGKSADSFESLWTGSTNALQQSLNALCSGTCSGTGDTADPFDSDNDTGTAYVSLNRRYPQGTFGSTKGADFWRMYRTLSSGANAATDHDTTQFGGYTSYPYNKVGAVRYYRYVAPSTGVVTVSIPSLGNHGCSDGDWLDMYVYDSGSVVGADETTTGCPSVSFGATAGNTYVITVNGYQGEVSSWSLQVQ